MVKRSYGLKLSFLDLIPDFKLISKMFKLGFPTSIEQSTRALGMTLITFLVGIFVL